MKDRVILLTSAVLVVTVALFAWFTWARWGVVGISPTLRWLVLGSAVFALSLATLFTLATRRSARARQRPAQASPRVSPAAAPPAEPENTKVTAVEMK
jgi:type VI protein secretion system component VasK